MSLCSAVCAKSTKMSNLTYRTFAFACVKTPISVFPRPLNGTAKCNLSGTAPLLGTGGHAETTSTTQGLSKMQAEELVLRLTSEERTILHGALQEYLSKLVKDEYRGG